AGHDEIESFCCACHNLSPPYECFRRPDLNQTNGGREGWRAGDYSALSVYDDRIDLVSRLPAIPRNRRASAGVRRIGYAHPMIICRIFGWVLLAAGFSVLLRDGLVWYDTG